MRRTRRRRREDGRDNGYRLRYWGDALKTVYAAQRDVDAYVSLCEETELVPARLRDPGRNTPIPPQARPGPRVGRARPRAPEAKPWGRGASYKLADMKRALLTKLGQGSEALASAWSEFEKYPCRLGLRPAHEVCTQGGASRVARQGDQCLGPGRSEFGHRVVARDQGDGTSGGTASRRLPPKSSNPSATTRPSLPLRSSCVPTRTSRRRSTAPWGCASSTRRRASTMMPHCQTSSRPNGATGRPD